MNVQENLDKLWKDCKRVLKVARKPDGSEYLDFSKITALGIVWGYWFCYCFNKSINWIIIFNY